MAKKFRRFQPVFALAMFLSFSAATHSTEQSVCGDDAAEPTKKAIALLKTFNTEFVHITPGEGKFPATFEMGSASGEAAERPVHRVKLEGDFWMAKYEVPQDLYEAVMGNNPSRWKGPRNSVEMLDLGQAVEFCHRATEMMRAAKIIAAGEEIRLPSEAEWEYCCRAGTTTAYSFGEEATADGDRGKQASVLDAYGWHTGNAAGNDPPVGALKPNPWGLYDMHGYLWEFVSDSWSDDHSQAPADGKSNQPAAALAENGSVVLRGGSWKDPYFLLRSSARRKAKNSLKDAGVGFRCVKAPVQSQKFAAAIL